VTYSLAELTIDRIAELRQRKQKKYNQVRGTRVTFSEIIDDAIRELNARVIGSTDDPTHGGRFNPEWMDTPEWQCPYCLEGETTPTLVGGSLVCPFIHCRKPRPEASYPEGMTLSPVQLLAREQWLLAHPPEPQPEGKPGSS